MWVLILSTFQKRFFVQECMDSRVVLLYLSNRTLLNKILKRRQKIFQHEFWKRLEILSATAVLNSHWDPPSSFWDSKFLFLNYILDACRILSPVLHHYGSVVVPCFTHANAEPLIGTTCLRYVSITNRKYNTELQKLREKLEILQKDREEREKFQRESQETQMDEAIELTNEKPSSSKM